jgi:hypothetical protein
MPYKLPGQAAEDSPEIVQYLTRIVHLVPQTDFSSEAVSNPEMNQIQTAL